MDQDYRSFLKTFTVMSGIFTESLWNIHLSQCNILDCAAADKTKMDSMRHRKLLFAEMSLLPVRAEQYDNTNWIMIWFLWQYTFLMKTPCHDSVISSVNILCNFESFLFNLCLNTIYFPTSTVQVKFSAQTCFPLFEGQKELFHHLIFSFTCIQTLVPHESW